MAGTSYGLIEVSGVVAAIDSLDAMCKAADVEMVTWERKLGGRLVTIIVEGTVSDCQAAVDAAVATCKSLGRKMATNAVIAAPSDEIRKMVALSEKRIHAQKEAAKESKDNRYLYEV